MDLKFKKDETRKVRIAFPDINGDKLSGAVASFAELVDFTPDAGTSHAGVATLKFRDDTVVEGGALRFGHPVGTLIFLESTP